MTSSESKRFFISKEPFSQERVRATQETVLELRKKYPEILGLGLFGSLSKGKSREESDIDGYLFVDADTVERSVGGMEGVVEYEREIKEGRSPTEKALGIKRLGVSPHFDKTTDERYETLLREGVKGKLGNLTEDQTNNLRVFPISEVVIDTLLKEFATNQAERDAFMEELKVAHAENQITTMEQLKRLVPDMKHNLPEITPDVSLFFSAMFFLEVGGGIRPYRRMLLQKLSAMGPLGERVWEGIMTATEEFERGRMEGDNGKSQPPKHYPKTLKEGIAVYG